MSAKTKYPTGIQDFEEVIKGGYAYVDKTHYIRVLIDMGKYYFLSRPRRFGKSLFVSTLEKYFEGRRELFKGLDIDTDDMDWTPKPVINFSFNTIDANKESALYEILDNALSFYEQKFNIIPKVIAPAERFLNLLRDVFNQTGQQIVVLVDEYDAPLLETLNDEKLNNSFRSTLRAFFSVLKNADEYIHFAFITGISRFSHTSLFSGANNLTDISLINDFSGICGITHEELTNVFTQSIHELLKA